uniref:Uncharacterized protein LOC104222355 isoform X2 n=1 Tax=Nicotiana sylvestris TaxID=4096 RepID=A0A1U7WCD4_NICSY|nr:PREDICTED: uncharacterized protein LOC104222355 isoform X2 [Nicotiana sylvestris]
MWIFCVTASCNKSKKGIGKYKSLQMDLKTKHGSKIPIVIPDDIMRVVGPVSRDIVNYCGLIMRSAISFRDGNWQAIIAKHGEAMWLKIKDKFEASGMRQHVLQALVVDTMQTLFRAWKTRLYADYSLYDTDEERLSHRPDDVTPEDWVFLVEHFGSPAFKAMSERNKLNRGKQTTKHSCGSNSFAEVEESTRGSSKKLWLNNNLKKMSIQ